MLIFTHFSSIFTHFHSFSHVVTAYFSLILHMLSLLIFHSFSLIFTHFYSFSLLCRHVVTSSYFFKKFYLSLDPPSDTFTHFYSFPQFHTCFSSFFTHFHSFPLLCRHVVMSSYFFKKFYLSLDPPLDIFQNT